MKANEVKVLVREGLGGVEEAALALGQSVDTIRAWMSGACGPDAMSYRVLVGVKSALRARRLAESAWEKRVADRLYWRGFWGFVVGAVVVSAIFKIFGG